MPHAPNIDDVLIQWGDRLFYPGNASSRHRRNRSWDQAQRDTEPPRSVNASRRRGAPCAPGDGQGHRRGRGVTAIAAHFRYISKNGRLDIEDERGETVRGRESLRELADDWRFGGSLIDDVAEPGQPRQAFNIMLSMPHGTDSLIVQKAAREFAQAELTDHKYVMGLHDHHANPHVHISVRAESKHGKRLNPRKADLHRWRETFAQKLCDWGIDAEATRQTT